jgi:cytoplasmic iron level regulating protein YaaA (DUF328/UPF0246 family)
VLDGRRKYEKTFRDNPIPALDRYNGILYRTDVSLKETIAAAIRGSAAEVVILSGGFGAVTASQRIQWYDQRFEFDHWCKHKVPEAREVRRRTAS